MSEATTVRLKTTGMHCQSCSMLIKMNLDDLPGVVEADADFRNGVTTVTYDPATVGVDGIVNEIRKSGYDAEPEV